MTSLLITPINFKQPIKSCLNWDTRSKKSKSFFFIHPSLRPILLGAVIFLFLNFILTVGVTFSPINKKFNFSYGNFLPTKLEILAQNNPKQLDILFLGTSQTNNGFIPKVFEKSTGHRFKSFNLGLPNNRYDIMQAYLTYHIQHYGRPKMVLIELSPSIQELNSYYYYLPALYYRTLVEHSPQQANQFLNYPHLSWSVKKEILLSSLSSLYQYRFTFSPLNILGKVSGKIAQVIHHNKAVAEEPPPISNSAPPIPVTLETDQKGWYPSEQSANMKTPEGVKLSAVEAKKYYFGHQKGIHFDKLKLLLAYCQKEHVKVVLVAWPEHPEFTRIFNESSLGKEYQQELAKLRRQTPITVINLKEHLSENPAPAIFADPRHLTPQGAEVYSKILAQEMLSLPLIQRQFKESGT